MMLRMLPHRAAHAAAHAAPHAAARAVAAHVHVDPAWCYGFRCACSKWNFQSEVTEANTKPTEAKTQADEPTIKFDVQFEFSI